MKLIFKLSFFYLLAVSCSFKTEPANTVPPLDSAYGFKPGDTFMHDSLKTYGFILIKIEPEILYFAPVKIDSTKADLDNILNGQIRFTPAEVLDPDNGKYGVECYGIMGMDDIKDFNNHFKKMGSLKLKKTYPEPTSLALFGLNYSSLSHFAFSYEFTWEGRAKMIKTKDLIE